MKLEDIDKAVNLREEIQDLETDIRILQKRKTYDGDMWLEDKESNIQIHLSGNVIEKAIDIAIRYKTDLLKKAKKDLMAL